MYIRVDDAERRHKARDKATQCICGVLPKQTFYSLYPWSAGGGKVLKSENTQKNKKAEKNVFIS